MEYVKVHQVPNTKLYRHKSIKFISNDINIKIIYIPETNEISVNDVKYKFVSPNGEGCKIYSITDADHILEFLSPSRLGYVYYIIKISDELKFTSFRGTPMYMTKTGFFKKRYHNGDRDDKFFYDYYDILTETWTPEFWKYAIEVRNFRYFVIHQNGRHLDFYAPVKFWIEDFQEKNPNFPQVSKYYYQEENIPSLKYSDTKLPVHFKDGTFYLSALELEELKSEFIYEQSLQGEIFLEEFTFKDYKNQSYAFLDYLNSYLLHLILKEKMVENLISIAKNELR